MTVDRSIAVPYEFKFSFLKAKMLNKHVTRTLLWMNKILIFREIQVNAINHLQYA